MSTAHYDVNGNIAVIRLDNPPVNGLGLELRRGIVNGIQQAEADDAVKAVVLIGSDRAFSGGADASCGSSRMKSTSSSGVSSCPPQDNSRNSAKACRTSSWRQGFMRTSCIDVDRPIRARVFRESSTGGAPGVVVWCAVLVCLSRVSGLVC